MKGNFVSFDSTDIVKPEEARETQYIETDISKFQTVRDSLGLGSFRFDLPVPNILLEASLNATTSELSVGETNLAVSCTHFNP